MNSPILSLSQLEAYDGQASRGTGSGSGRGEQRFLCPLCGDGKARDSAHRSLAVNLDSGAWHCFRCGESGLLRDKWSQSDESPQTNQTRLLKRQKTQRQKAQLHRQFAVPVPVIEVPEKTEWRSQLKHLRELEGTRGASYLSRRGLTLEVALRARCRFSANWFGRPAVVLPIYNEGGHLVAAQGRYIDGRNDPKARTAGGRKYGVFATSPDWWEMVEKGAPLIITEAPLDALSLAMCGFPALALCGKEGWPRWLPIKCAFRRVAIAFDADVAGDEGAEKLAAALRALGAQPFRLRPDQLLQGPEADTAHPVSNESPIKDWNDGLQRWGQNELADLLASHLLVKS